jgi:hypothetical protein
MRKGISILSCVLAFVAWTPNLVWSQGKGSGVNRGLGNAAAKSAAGNAANQAVGQASSAAINGSNANAAIQGPKGRAGGGVLPAGVPATAAQKGIGRAGEALARNKNLSRFFPAGTTRGIQASSSDAETIPRELESKMTPEKIQFKRIQQADHLRAISERNGNEALLETADRMESSANRNYERQMANAGLATDAGSVSNSEPALANEEVTSPANAGDTLVTPATAPKPANRKGFWFRWR